MHASPAAGEFDKVRLVLAAAIGMVGGFGPMVSGAFSLFLKPLALAMGWTRLEASFLSSASFLGYGLGGPAFGLLIARFGYSRVLVPGIAGLAAGLCVFGLLPPHLVWFVIASLLVGVVGTATAPTGYVLMLTGNFERRLGTAIGFAMLGHGLGLVTMPIVAQALIGRLGWRGAYAGLGVIAAVFGSAAVLVAGIGRLSRQRPPSAGPDAVPSARTPGDTLGQALRSWRFWLISAATLIIGTAAVGGAVHISALLSDRGVSPRLVARLTGISGAGVLIGRSGTAMLMDRIYAPLVAACCCALGGLGMFLVSTLPIHAYLPLVGAGLLTGLLLGCEIDIMAILTRRFFGSASFAAIYGSIVPCFAAGGVVGPLLFGYLHDRTGDYGAIYAAAALACGVTGVALLTLGPYRYPTAKAHQI